jgi:AcrR family transcriptional regulator
MSQNALHPTLRNQPVQARSSARLEEILDAATHVIDRVGIERLTTAMVAKRAGCAIGTVYRYFPERISLLQAVTARSLQRFRESALPELRITAETDWGACLAQAFALAEHAFRTVPGFRSLRLGDVLDLVPRPVSALTEVAASLSELAPVDSEEERAALRDRLEIAIVLVDAMLARAFIREPAGDQTIVDEARRIAMEYLSAPAPVAERAGTRTAPHSGALSATQSHRAKRDAGRASASSRETADAVRSPSLVVASVPAQSATATPLGMPDPLSTATTTIDLGLHKPLLGDLADDGARRAGE